MVPTDADIKLKVGVRTYRLAYHPCVGEFLFGRRTYALRKKLLAPDTPARAPPRPRERPRVKERARPRATPPAKKRRAARR